MQGKT
jgi:hypothetical protein